MAHLILIRNHFKTARHNSEVSEFQLESNIDGKPFESKILSDSEEDIAPSLISSIITYYIILSFMTNGSACNYINSIMYTVYKRRNILILLHIVNDPLLTAS